MAIYTQTICQDRRNCIGCGTCAVRAAHTWSMNVRDGKADLLGGTSKGDVVVARVHGDAHMAEDNVRAAADCPARVIRIEQTTHV